MTFLKGPVRTYYWSGPFCKDLNLASPSVQLQKWKLLQVLSNWMLDTCTYVFSFFDYGKNTPNGLLSFRTRKSVPVMLLNRNVYCSARTTDRNPNLVPEAFWSAAFCQAQMLAVIIFYIANPEVGSFIIGVQKKKTCQMAKILVNSLRTFCPSVIARLIAPRRQRRLNRASTIHNVALSARLVLHIYP